MNRKIVLAILCLPLLAAASSARSEDGMKLDICPNNYTNFPMDGPALTCGCSAEQAKEGATIWGTNPYQYYSSLCRAALHAGAITAGGGTIIVTPKAKVPFFPAVRRNGIDAASTGGADGFTVAATDGSKVVGPFEIKDNALTLDVCPSNYTGFPDDAPVLTCGCSAEQVKDGGTIWGTNPYQNYSSLCRAAVHAGAIKPNGGMIVVKPVREAPFYPSVTKNGIDSASTGSSIGFSVEAVGGATAAAAAQQQQPQANGMVLDICPNNYTSFPMDTPALTCGCSAEQVKDGGTIWGTNPYYSYSSLCRAAAHAGAITMSGGQITVTPAADVPVYPAVTKNGIESASTGRADGFRVMGEKHAAAKPAVEASGAPVQAPIAETLKATGRVQLYVNFATDQAVPLPSSTPVLMELLDTLNNDPALKLELIGHTDNEGGASYNLDLSQRRAAGIYFYLVKSGVAAERLKSSGHGLMEPIADNATAEGRALNRRVEARQMQ